MARRITQKSLKQDEFVEAAFDAGAWLEEHWKPVALGIAVVIAAILLGVVWKSWSASRLAAAGDAFGQGFDLYRTASLSPPAAADEIYIEAQARFEEAADGAGRSQLAEVAAFYQAISRLRAGETDPAIGLLEDLSRTASNPVLANSAKANLAEALTAAGDIAGAEAVWRDLAQADSPYFPESMALLSLAKLLMGADRQDEALDLLQRVVDEHPQTASANEATTLLEVAGVSQ